MTHLGNVPSGFAHSAARIFRCYTCDNVVSDEW
jgi:hypothetical protein